MRLRELSLRSFIVGRERAAVEIGVDLGRVNKILDSTAHPNRGISKLLACSEASFDRMLREAGGVIKTPQPKTRPPRAVRVSKPADTTYADALSLAKRIMEVVDALRERNCDRRQLRRAKASYVAELGRICKERGWAYGHQVSRVGILVFFDVPEVGQLSWYCQEASDFPTYQGKWDGTSARSKLFPTSAERKVRTT